MDRRDFLTAATSLLAAGSPSGGGLLKRTVAQQPEYSFLPRSVGQEVNPGLHPLDKPNILLIFADDLGYHDLSCYDSEIPTPHIDSLARQGARLTDWYVSAPICTPSRYSLLTGQFPLRSKDKLVGPLMTLWAEEQDIGIRENETTLAELLRDGGYRTAMIGKWHLGHGDKKFFPTRHGFDYFYGCTGGVVDYFTLKYGYLPDWWRNEKQAKVEGYATDLLSEEAVQYIQSYDSEQPFFLYLPYNAPHYGKGWDEKEKRVTNILQAKPEDIATFKDVENPERRVYSAMVKALDDGVGQVLSALRDRGVEENTLVIFTSDNGGDNEGFGGRNDPLRGNKGSLWEGGIRVPCLMRWPGRIETGITIHQPCSSLDLLPTLSNWLSLKTTGLTLDGMNILPVLLEGERFERDLFFLFRDQLAFRRGPWKLWQPSRGGQPLLFHLREDLAEQHDLAGKNPEKVRELQAAHAAIKATLPL